MKPVIAIDGPSGAGKSTVARGVADRLGLDVLDTGAMYRAVTLAVLDRAVDPDDATACAAVAREVRIDTGDAVSLDGRDVTREIRSPEVTAAVSAVSAHPPVRSALVERQRAWVDERGSGVVEGRDIGSVVFPDAPLKIFLTADATERAQRRHRDDEDSRYGVEVNDIREEIDRRDRLDSTREASPLQAAPGAVHIDTTGRSPDDVVDEIVERFTTVMGGAR